MFYEQYKTMKIDIFLNQYKRPYIWEQLESIYNQTEQFSNLWIRHNWTNVSLDDIEKNIKRHNSPIRYVHSFKNLGVWSRFAYGLNSNADYLLFLDDDIVLEPKWLENCLHCMQKKEWLYVGVGNTYTRKDRRRPLIRHWYVENNNQNIKQVDIWWHSRFMKRDWLNYFWEETPPIEKYPCNWEDMRLSYQLQRHWINTYVPPHKYNDTESRCTTKSYWDDEHATCITNQDNYNQFFLYLVNKGRKLQKFISD